MRPYLRAANVTWSGLDLSDVKEMNFDDADFCRFRLHPGDVLINEGSGSAAEVGKPAIWRDEIADCCFQNTLLRVQPRACSPEYTYNYIRSCAKSGQFIASTQGVNIFHIGREGLAQHPFPLPPWPEQQRIVAKIDSLSAKSKRARVHLDQVPRLIEKYKQAILGAAFRGMLSDSWRAHHESDNISTNIRELLQSERDKIRNNQGLRSKGKNRSLPGRASVLPFIPRTWAWCTFDDCSWDLTVGHVGSMKDRYVDEGVPFLRSLNIKPNHIKTEKLVYIDAGFHQELQKSKLSPGDVVVVRTGDPGVAAVIPKDLPVANCSDLIVVRLINLISPHYAAHYMNSDFAKSIVRGVQVGVAQQHFNVGAMSEMPIPITTLREQSEIVKEIDAAFLWIDRLASEAISARKLIDHLDHAVLSKAFRGELVPQDPNDEPASVLLERINAERTGVSPARRGRGRPRLAATR